MNLGRAYAWCREVTERSKTSFNLAIRMLPREKRRSLHAIYAYCRLADDVSDDGGDENRLKDPRLVAALEDTIARYSIPRRHFDEILEGTRIDLEPRRYADFEELRKYCHLVAGAVGLACLHVFGFRDPSALSHAEDLGLAMQLTNIVRDVREDAERGRVYLPQEEMRRFGVSERDLLGRRPAEDVRDLLRFQVARAREIFQRGERLVPLVNADARRCPAAIAAVYRALLDRIEAKEFDVFSRRIRLSPAQKLKVVASLL